MKIINLIENTPGVPGCLYEHGLSFYIETQKHKVLVDTGASHKFIQNAKLLGVDLTQVDTLVLSHGHYDHGGGILDFVKVNKTAKIYMQKTAKEAYYHVDLVRVEYIGIDPKVLALEQVVFLEESQVLDEELYIFSGVREHRLWPKGNLVLKKKTKGGYVQDGFEHEQYLVLNENEKKILISGCAHNGILNILEKYRFLYGADPDVVISGFHMMKHSEYTEEDIRLIRQIAEELKKTQIRFYTGHCTAEYPYQLMKKILGKQLSWVHSGEYVLE